MTSLPIVTHSGHFHADEVTACAILDLINRWSGRLIRTRDPAIIAEMDRQAYVVDVGQIDNQTLLRFDHHQPSFDKYFNSAARELGVKMSSCGLIYLAYGAELLTKFGIDPYDYMDEFYDKHILEIDANDNGISEFKNPPDYAFRTSYSLPTIVGKFNGTRTADEGPLADEQDIRFMKAIKVVKTILTTYLTHFKAKKDDEARTREIISRAVPQIHENGYLVWILPEKCDYYVELREKMKEDQYMNKKWIFTVLPRDGVVPEEAPALPSVGPASGEALPPPRLGANAPRWQIHTVNLPGEKFKHYADIVSSEQAKAIIGQDLIFVHANRFIAVTKTKESALALTRASVRVLLDAKAITKHQRDRWIAVGVVEILTLAFVILDQGKVGLSPEVIFGLTQLAVVWAMIKY